MTDKNSFDNLRTLHVATTPGDWEWYELMNSVVVADGFDRDVVIAQAVRKSEAAFIVSAHNKLPALLARLDEVTAERDALTAVIEKGLNWLDVIDVYQYESDSARVSDVRNALKAAPSSVLAAHDAKVRAEALREAADDYRQQALPVNSELSMLGGAGPFVDKGIEGYMEAQHDAWDWLRARADEEENR